MYKLYINKLARLLALWLVVGFSTLTGAQTVWTGATSNDWFDATNWSAGLPAEGNDATVPGGGAVVINKALNAKYDVANFGAITASKAINIRGAWSNSGDFITTDRINVYGSLQNFGSLELRDELGTLWVGDDALLRSNGSILITKWMGVRGRLINDGTIDVEAGATLVGYAAGALENPGIVDVVGNFVLRETSTYSSPSGGTINVLDQGLLHLLNEASLNNAGIVNVESGGRFFQRATLNNNPGRIFVSGLLRAFSNSTTVSNFLTIREGGLLRVEETEQFTIAFSLVNEGTCTIAQPLTVRGIVENAASGKLNITGSGELDFIAGTNLTNAGSVVNSGKITTVGTIANSGTFVNRGTVRQNNGGSLINDRLFRNEALLENINRIVNNDAFVNEGRMTNGSGGTIENNKNFTNAKDAHVENLFVITNNDRLVNYGFFENGVSLINNKVFDNHGFLSNVGDITNTADGHIINRVAGVIDNSDSGIFTNDGFLRNLGEINIFDCGVFVNNARITNDSWITNNGLYFENGTLTGKAIMGNGPVVPQDGTSPLICQPFKQKLDQTGKTRVSATRFATAGYDSCSALQYLINGEESLDLTCADLGTQEVMITLVDRKGNRVNCKTTLEVTDEFAPVVSTCPGDISKQDVDAAPVAVNWVAPRFTDNCDATVDVTSNFNPGDRFPEGSTVVTYTARDDAGNEFICEFTVTVTVKEQGCQPKNDKGLVLYYNFLTQGGRFVFDRAGYGNRLHAEIKDTRTTKWTMGNGLLNTGNSIVKSSGNGARIGEALQMTNALTVEAWVRADRKQSGPARVVTYSENVSKRNFTLGQENDRWVFRLKTTHTNDNGMPDRRAKSNSVKVGQLQHIVFTRAANGQERFYVDGELQYSDHVGGNFSSWGKHCHIALFNEMSNDRSFKGLLKNIAFYDRALTRAEVLASRARGVCEDGDDSPAGQLCPGTRGEVTYERYDDITGSDLPWLYKVAKFPASPDATRKLSELRIPSNVRENYGSRTRGFIYPKQTGNYQFAVSGDDNVALLLSERAGEPAYAYWIAGHHGWTNPGELHKYNGQKSRSLHLEAGKAYYFEFQQKEGAQGDHGAVFWKRPGRHNFELIGKEYIGDIKKCASPEGPNTPQPCAGAKGGLLREVWRNVNSSDIWALLRDPRYPDNPSASNVINSFAGPVSFGDNYGTRVRGYIHPTVTGDYRFTVTGDNQTKLMLSTDDSEDNSRPIAEVSGWTGQREFHKFSSQNSAAIRLEAGKRYYVELIHQEGRGGDHFSVFWRTPNNHTRHVIPGANLSTYVECDDNGTEETCKRDVLLVVGSTHLNNGDASVKRRLQDLGYNVQVIKDSNVRASNANGKGLVIISSTSHSGSIGSRLRDVAVPVLAWEAWLFDDMRMTANQQGRDYGKSHDDDLIIVGSGKLVAGRSGRQKVYNHRRDLQYGKVMGSDAKILAHAPADPWMASVFYYEQGDRMAGGMNAPALRIGFFLDNDGAASWTGYGRTLFDNLVRFATGCEGATANRTTADVLSLNAEKALGDVELKWVSNTAFKDETYLVERSTDDVNYFVIGEVAPTGQGEDLNSYVFLDESPVEGANYYRVTAVYTDGNDRQSELRLVEYAPLGVATLFPNPASAFATISLQGFEDRAVDVTLTDALGRQVFRRTVAVGSQRFEFNVEDLPNGWYAVGVHSGDFKAVKRLLVAHD